MFKLGFEPLIFLACLSQPLLKGRPITKLEVVLQRVPAVRIPGGLTPP